MRWPLLVRATVAFLVLPGAVGYLVPLLLGREAPPGGPLTRLGVLLVASGSLLLLWCVREFPRAGDGTLAPWDPPRRLVRGGVYGKTRNPMYVALVVVLLGWSAWFGSLGLCLYALVITMTFHLMVVLYEEPRLAREFGQQWEAYRGRVPRWLL